MMSKDKSKAVIIWESWGKIVLLIAGALILAGVTLAITEANNIYKGSNTFALLVFVAYIVLLLIVNTVIKKTLYVKKRAVVLSEISAEQLTMIISLLGGRDNILGVESCLTRLRIKIKDTDEVDTSNAWKESGAQGVIIKDDSVQAIFGEKTEALNLELIKKLNL